MAESLVQVANVALLLIGQQRITALTDDNDAARFMNEVMTPTLDAKIRMHSWNCFQMRVALNELTAAPAFGYAHQFQLPQDPLCLDVLETSLNDDEAWRIETYETVPATQAYRVIVTDATTVSILYLARITDATRWDPLFADAMATELAYRASYPLTRNANLKAVLQKEAEEMWAKAKSRDGQESRALKSLRSTSLTAPRFGGSWGGERLP